MCKSGTHRGTVGIVMSLSETAFVGVGRMFKTVSIITYYVMSAAAIGVGPSQTPVGHTASEKRGTRNEERETRNEKLDRAVTPPSRNEKQHSRSIVYTHY